MKLRRNQPCPIHKGLYCCGRARPEQKKYQVSAGVVLMPDGREVCSPMVLRMRKDKMLKANPFCAACGERFDDYNDVDLAHRESKGMGGGRRDDRQENLCLMHRVENLEQGSRSLSDYLQWRIEKQLPVPAEAFEEINKKRIHAVEA